jgi:AraC family transcriptional regulator
VKSSTLSFYETAVRRALLRIVAQLDEALDLPSLAREAALSPLHFHRVFRGMVGETPLELHRRLRLERAAFELTTGDAPVTRIAFDAGYETHEAFTRAFRLAFACSPSELRKAAQAANDPNADSALAAPRRHITARVGVHFDPAYVALKNDPAAAAASVLPASTFLPGVSLMNVEIRELPALRLATVTHRGPYPQISQAFAKLAELAGPAGLFTAPDITMIALYHDDPETTPPDELRSEAALTIAEHAVLPAGLGEARIAAGSYATTTHVGPYNALGDVWARLMGDWLPRSGKRLGPGTSFEIYRNTPADVAPESLVTELYLPIV